MRYCTHIFNTENEVKNAADVLQKVTLPSQMGSDLSVNSRKN
ncbi:MAG: hypothetical protein AB7P09_04975 [Pyrinomonadaceae bacterium]